LIIDFGGGRLATTRQKRASKHRCHTRASGYPVRCGFSNDSQAPLEYWIVRSSRTMTEESAEASTSSQTRCSAPQPYMPESLRHSPSSPGGRGKCRVLDAPAGGARIQNIENNPMQSSLAVAGRHARSREDVLTCRRKRAPLRQIGTTGKLRMARMHAAPVGLIQTECFRERAGIDSMKPVISSHPRSTLAPDPRFAGRMVWGRYSGTADFSAASSASFEGEGIWRPRMRLPHPNPPAKCGRGSA